MSDTIAPPNPDGTPWWDGGDSTFATTSLLESGLMGAIARRLPDGLIVGGVFYPFMVDCFPCNSTGRANVSPARACSTCDGTGQVRNPALEWRCAQWGHVHWSSSLLRGSSPYVDECLLVAVGVKEVSE